MAGRMIGHSFLHGGPCLSGLSLPVIILLTGGDADSAASALTLQDCPDIDHRETISLVSTCNLLRYFSTRFLLFVWKWHWIIVIFFHIFNLLLQLKKTELTEKEMTRLTDLCLFWDLPVPSSSNQDWLFQQLLSHAVSFAVLFV